MTVTGEVVAGDDVEALACCVARPETDVVLLVMAGLGRPVAAACGELRRG